MAAEFAVNEIADRGLAVLRVSGDLGFEARTDFKNALQRLEASDEKKYVVDMTLVTQLTSLYIGSLTDFANRVTSSGKHLAVLLNPRIARICEELGLDKVAQVIVPDGTAG